jgi:hypothetical protein
VESDGPFGQGVHELVHQRIIAVTHFIGRALGGNFSVGQNDDLIGNVECFVEVVRDHDAGQTHGVIEFANQAGCSAQGNRVQAGEGLVVHHQFRVERNGAGQRHAARHTARHFGGQEVAGTAQPHGIELHENHIADQVF